MKSQAYLASSDILKSLINTFNFKEKTHELKTEDRLILKKYIKLNPKANIDFIFGSTIHNLSFNRSLIIVLDEVLPEDQYNEFFAKKYK